MKKNNTLITAVLYFILTMAGCGNNVEKKFAENQAKKFQEVTKALHMEGDAPLADTLFHYSVPTPGQGNGAFIYVVNPECSFCIGNAIQCYRAYLDSGSALPFLFLQKSYNSNIFEYYLNESGLTSVIRLTSEECSTLEDGLYSLQGKKVEAYYRWN
jgi:hypothetical protein